MSYTPWNHIPQLSQPTPPSTTLRVQGRTFSTYESDLLRELAADLPEMWGRVESVVAKYCPDATVTDWRPGSRSLLDLGVWRVHVAERSGTERLRRVTAMQRALGALCVVVEVVG